MRGCARGLIPGCETRRIAALGEKGRDRLRHAGDRFFTPSGRRQREIVLLVGRIAEFEQHGGDIRRLQHAETGRTLRIFIQPRGRLPIIHQSVGEDVAIGLLQL